MRDSGRGEGQHGDREGLKESQRGEGQEGERGIEGEGSSTKTQRMKAGEE